MGERRTALCPGSSTSVSLHRFFGGVCLPPFDFLCGQVGEKRGFLRSLRRTLSLAVVGSLISCLTINHTSGGWGSEQRCLVRAGLAYSRQTCRHASLLHNVKEQNPNSMYNSSHCELQCKNHSERKPGLSNWLFRSSVSEATLKTEASPPATIRGRHGL